MDNITLYIDNDKVFKLKFFDAMHPKLVNVKADHWKFIYQLYFNGILFDDGLFSSNHFISDKKQILILEEYDISVLNQDKIKTDEDVVLNLRLFDFIQNKTGKFSKMTGGSFLFHKLFDNDFIFSKQYFDKISQFEINIDKIACNDIYKA